MCLISLGTIEEENSSNGVKIMMTSKKKCARYEQIGLFYAIFITDLLMWAKTTFLDDRTVPICCLVCLSTRLGHMYMTE